MALAQDLIGQNAGSNPGLALTKLAPPLKDKEEWSAHLKRIVDAPPPKDYDDAFARLRARTAAGPSYRQVLLATSLSPVVCGMGERTPGENGLTLHPVYGVPYLPGTSLKGILRAWVLSQTWGDDWQEGGKYFRALFGQGGHDGEGAVVDILDALPAPSSSMLTLDVLTPHHAEYYRSGGRVAPLGWEGPNPVQFLAAAKGVSYRVVIEGDPAWVGKAAEWLSLALNERGIGAKSRAGYGRFECEMLSADHPKEREAAECNASARRSNTDQLIDDLLKEQPQTILSAIESWLQGKEISRKEGRLPELLSAGPADTSAEYLRIVRKLGEEFNFRSTWQQRTKRKKTDEARKARARAFIEAWDKLFPEGGTG